jgi:2,3-bisphosphoglycerate-independent phosphoglycerate mutase
MAVNTHSPIVLLILDGWGLAPASDNNPISLANTPNFDLYWQQYPHTAIGAAGAAIGLPADHQGSTEIGHYIMGAGRNVLLPQTQISAALAAHTFSTQPAFVEALDKAKKSNSAVHLFGLLQDAGVHAYSEAGLALVQAAKAHGLDDVFIHLCLDGRDAPPQSATDLLPAFTQELATIGVGKIATIMGRWWAMDRDRRWERVEGAYHAMVDGATQHATDPLLALQEAYTRGETDEFVVPTTITDTTGRPITRIADGDIVINWNFRVDREIEITQAFIETDFQGFTRARFPRIHYVGTTQYYENMPASHAFNRDEIVLPLGEVVSKAGKKQYRITETEKWPYVTKVFNAMREEPYPGEERLLLPSDKIATFDLAPEMQVAKITDAVLKRLADHQDDLIVINYPNPDMLAHTGNKVAMIKGIEACDHQLGRLAEAVRSHGGTLFVTADHGNAEVHLDEKTGAPHTSHTTADVPLILISAVPGLRHAQLRTGGALRDIAPTILDLLAIPKPAVMDGSSLLRTDN